MAHEATAQQHDAPAPVAMDHPEPNYLAVFVYLTILTALELIVYYMHLPKLAMISLLVALAWAKAVLVAMYFMHLAMEKRTLAIIAMTPAILVTYLCFMLLPDLTARIWASTPMHQQIKAEAHAAPGH
ncbi:MAG: cytochrome C oxidase subunit IV family protein [Candidatus Binataceae bacterium]